MSHWDKEHCVLHHWRSYTVLLDCRRGSKQQSHCEDFVVLGSLCQIEDYSLLHVLSPLWTWKCWELNGSPVNFLVSHSRLFSMVTYLSLFRNSETISKGETDHLGPNLGWRFHLWSKQTLAASINVIRNAFL